MIELLDVSAGYGGVPILEHVTLSFPEGSVTALLGPNGCGKSTLLKTALGLLPRLAGRILYDGTDLDTLSPREIARRAAYLCQSRNVPSITAERMVLHGRVPYLSYPRRYRREDRDAVQEALRMTGSLDLAGRPMGELSGGQRQKIYLSMALAQDTPAILMDEPTTYLDVHHQLEFMETAGDLARSGKAVVMVLHDLGLALRYAGRVAVLTPGGCVRAGTPEEIFSAGVLDRVFGVNVRRVPSGDGWHYYCESRKEP